MNHCQFTKKKKIMYYKRKTPCKYMSNLALFVFQYTDFKKQLLSA